MSISSRIPLMEPGRTKRNLFVAFLYFVLLPFVVLLAPFYVAFAIGTNRNGWGERIEASPLGRLPGVRRGGWTAGFAMCGYVLLVFLVIGAAAPETETASNGSENIAAQAETLTTDVGSSSATLTGAREESPAETRAEPSTEPSESDGSRMESDTETELSTTTTEETSTETTTNAPTPTPATTETFTPTTVETPTPTTVETPTPTPTATSTPTPTPKSEPDQRSDSAPETSREVTITRVVDGDTFEVRFPDGREDTVRLLGVDTPEVHVETQPEEFDGVPDSEAGHNWLRDWGHRASEFARADLAGETVRIEVDDRADRRGSYDRLLVYVYTDGGESFNRELIDQGYARMYDSTFSKRSAFMQAEAEAQRSDVGLWNYEAERTPTPERVRADGSGQGTLAVAEIAADSSGNDHDNENGEYIVLRNTGENPLDLTGWHVEDEADHTYAFPSGFALEPGATVTLYTGSGQNTGSEVYWGSGSAVWNNGGDTVIVTDDTGDVVVREEY